MIWLVFNVAALLAGSDSLYDESIQTFPDLLAFFSVILESFAEKILLAHYKFCIFVAYFIVFFLESVVRKVLVSVLEVIQVVLASAYPKVKIFINVNF